MRHLRKSAGVHPGHGRHGYRGGRVRPVVASAADRPVCEPSRLRPTRNGNCSAGSRPDWEKSPPPAGMRLCYHHHMGTGVMTRADVDRLMASTDPELVHLFLDTGAPRLRRRRSALGRPGLRGPHQARPPQEPATPDPEYGPGQQLSFKQAIQAGSSPYPAIRTVASTSPRSCRRLPIRFQRLAGRRSGAGPSQGQSSSLRDDGSKIPSRRDWYLNRSYA